MDMIAIWSFFKPILFSKTPVVAFLRGAGLHISLYVDDFILAAPASVIKRHNQV